MHEWDYEPPGEAVKSKAIYTPIETPCGMLRGRTDIWLGDVHLVDRVLTLEVDIRSNRPNRDAIPFDMVFHGVVGLKITELDVWGENPESRHSKGGFEEVTGSAMLASIAFRFEGWRHFAVMTYDDVFDIVAERYEFFDVTPTPEERMKAAQEHEG